MLDAPMGAEQVRGTYRELLGSTSGWSEHRALGQRGGGFAVGPLASALLFCEEGSASALTVITQELPHGQASDVRLRLETGPRSPCARKWRERVLDEGWLIPGLVPPTGAHEHPQGRLATRQPEFENSSLIVDANMGLAEIAAHYNAQLASGGWTLTDENLNGPQASSSWELSDEQGQSWVGVFAALGLPETSRRYLLRVLVYRRAEHRAF